MTIIFDRRHSLVKTVAKLMKERGVKLEPGESLQVSIISSRHREAGGFWITCPKLAPSKMDKIFSSKIETIELGYKRRYEILRKAGYEYVGQLWRTYRFSKHRPKVKGVTQATLKRIGAYFMEIGLTQECEEIGFHSWPCGLRELKKLRTVSIRSFLLEAKLFDKLTREEFSKLGICTLGDLLDVGYEKVKGCFVRARIREFKPSWNGEKTDIRYCGLGRMDDFLEVLSRFGLTLDKKVLRGKGRKKKRKNNKDFLDF